MSQGNFALGSLNIAWILQFFESMQDVCSVNFADCVSGTLVYVSSFHYRLKGHNKRPHRVDVTKLPPQSEGGETNGPTPVKAARMAGVHDPHDPNSSDHVVAVTQLKEKIAHLQKQISIKDSQLLAKDRQVRNKIFASSCFLKQIRAVK